MKNLVFRKSVSESCNGKLKKTLNTGLFENQDHISETFDNFFSTHSGRNVPSSIIFRQVI